MVTLDIKAAIFFLNFNFLILLISLVKCNISSEMFALISLNEKYHLSGSHDSVFFENLIKTKRSL